MENHVYGCSACYMLVYRLYAWWCTEGFKSLELELVMAVEHHVGEKNLDHLREHPWLFTAELSFQPANGHILKNFNL